MPKSRTVHAVDNDDTLVDKVDEWRRRQPEIPARAAAVRELIRRGLKVVEKHT